MNDPFPEELLSAYLDGELPDDERARVEDWLAASADHRRLCDDLQAIRRELQALPQESLDVGFSDRVLAAIRARSGDSSGRPPLDGPGAADPEPIQPGVKPASLQPRHLGMPAWRWFVAGVAATLATVLVGVNAVPETMAQMGKLAQLTRQESSGDKPAASQPVEPSLPKSRGESPAKPESDPLGTKARESLQGDGGAERAGAFRKDTVPAELEQQGDTKTPAAPGLRNDAVPAPPGSQSNEEFADGRGNLAKQDRPTALADAGGASAGQERAESDNVPELPVTSDQADRALSFALDADSQAVRRYTAAPVELANAATVNQYFDRDSYRETYFNRSALQMMQQNDANAQGVQIAAVEVTGTEPEVQSLLDSLGVDTARYLRPRNSLAGGGSGSEALALREAGAIEGELKAQAGLSEGSSPKPGASPLPKRRASSKGAAAMKEESKSDASGGGPAVGPAAETGGGFGGGSSEPEFARKMVERARQLQVEGLGKSTPQLRVRLVIVPPQADPIGPTIQRQPAE